MMINLGDALYRQIYLRMILIISFSMAISGCVSSTSKEIYEDNQLNIQLEYPKTWNLELSERVDNSIVLQSDQGIFEENSARVEILVGVPINSPIDLEEGLEKRISNLGHLYDLGTVTVIQSPSQGEREDYEIATAIISIPTMKIPDNSPVNQLNHRDFNVSQIICLYTLRNENDFDIEVSIYKGNSDELNNQAEDIVNSIKYIAP